MSNPLVVYSIFKAPISYIGELESNSDTEVKLSRALMLYQTPTKGGDSEQITIASVPFASRDSTVTIPKQAVPGVLIEKVDEDLLSHYGKEIVAAYSKLKVIA